MNTRTLVITLVGLALAAGPAAAQGSNERVHVLQKRDYSIKNKVELNVFAGASLGDVFTQNFAVGLAVDYHLNEAFAIEASWFTSGFPAGETNSKARFGMLYTSAFDEISDASLRPESADLAMIGNCVSLNVQFSPIYGKFTLFNKALGHADFFLTAGGGVAWTEYKDWERKWKDTGTYFVGNFGLGFRIFLTRWFALRLELRDYAFSARVVEPSGAESTKIRNSLFFMLGLSFLFGGEEPVEIWSPY
jgi:outer membrane beta-barrel protein